MPVQCYRRIERGRIQRANLVCVKKTVLSVELGYQARVGRNLQKPHDSGIVSVERRRACMNERLVLIISSISAAPLPDRGPFMSKVAAHNLHSPFMMCAFPAKVHTYEFIHKYSNC
jgi:hypothetical protein